MQTGRVLGGRYTIEERIGSGGMSTVYKAHEIELDREVAVKVLISSLSDDPQLVERFNREAKMIASLQHNAIIPIYYYGTEDDFGSYLVMPMLKGGTLEQRLHQLEILPSLTEVGELAERLGGALQYAHDKGIVHRDIKFSNIMFDDAGSPYLMDFGIAKLLNTTNLTGTGMTVGTPNFMPPEQWRNDEITPAVDQYAFSVLLFAMLTRRMPFEADTAPALMYQHLQEIPPLASQFRDDVPGAIENALHRALSKEPEERFASIAEFTTLISQTALATTRKYSGFFKAEIEDRTQPKQTPTGMPQQRVMPNTPTKMVAESKLDGAKTTLSNEVSPGEPVQAEQASGGTNRIAFFGGMIGVIVIGALIIAGLFFRNRQTIADEQTATALAIHATETSIAFAAQVALDATDTEIAFISATETESAEPTATHTAAETLEATATHTATGTAEATDTATNTPTNTPDLTATQAAINQTVTAGQQSTENALLRLTATAISIFQTERAGDDATATQNAIHSAETATEEQAQANNRNSTATADAQNSTSVALEDHRNSTATAFAIIQADFDATATRLAVLATEALLTVNPIEYGIAVSDTGFGATSVEWSFEAQAGDVISIVARAIDFDPVIELYSGERFLLADDNSGYRDNARIENLRIEEDGIYRLILRGESGADIEGDYSVGITDMETCPNELAPRILVGDFARVTLDGLKNNVRINPMTDSSRVAQIPQGDVFVVLQGPRCSDGFTWYRVDYDGAVGWTAEADDDEYWLELLPEDDEPVLLAGGEGLTNGQELNPGEMQVESFCLARGLDAATDTVNWFCQNSDGVIIMTLVEEDFDELCQSTYDEEEAFARQDGDASEPAYQWLCYYFPG